MKAAGTKATKKDGRGREGGKETFSSKRRDSENALAHKRNLRLVQQSGVECKAINTPIKLADEMLRKFYLNRA